MIGLIDCNNFFVSCERLFRPDLRTKPVLVLSSNDGCVVARSQEVKDMGIAMGVPYFEIKDICLKERIYVFSSNFSLYRDISSRVMSILEEIFPVCEKYSVDEAFVIVPDTVDLSFMIGVRERIIRETGIPISFGVGRTKTIAKCAALSAKRGTGICRFAGEEWQRTAAAISCGSVWGIGRSMTATLTRAGIQTAADIRNRSSHDLQILAGVHGERVWFELHEMPVYQVSGHVRYVPQSISSSRSFIRQSADSEILRSALGMHVARAVDQLLLHNLVAQRLTVHAWYPRREGVFEECIDLPVPTQSITFLMKEAMDALERIRGQGGHGYKKIGVTLSQIAPLNTVTETLFAHAYAPGKREIDTLFTMCRTLHGKDALQLGTMVGKGQTYTSQQFVSPRYTSQWDEIPRIKAV